VNSGNQPVLPAVTGSPANPEVLARTAHEAPVQYVRET